MEMLPDSPTSPLAVLASAREQVASLTETLWAAARPAGPVGRHRRAGTAPFPGRRGRGARSPSRSRPPRPPRQKAGSHPVTGSPTPPAAGTATAPGCCAPPDRCAATGARRWLALQAGDVSPEHAEVIVAVIDRLPVQPGLRDEAERMLLDQAASLNASELRKAGEHLLEILDPDGTARVEEAALDRLERSAHLGRFLTLSEDGIGGVRLRGRGTVEDAALIKNALHALAAPRPGTDPDCGETATRPAATTAPAPGTPWSRPASKPAEVRRAAAGAARRQTTAHRHRHPRAAPRQPRRRHPRHRRPGQRDRAPAAGLRRRRDPRRPRLPRRGPRRRPHPTPRHHRHLESPHPARPALPLPRLPPDAAGLRRPPPPALGRRRRHLPRQPGPALPSAPHPHPCHPVAGPPQPTSTDNPSSDDHHDTDKTHDRRPLDPDDSSSDVEGGPVSSRRAACG